MEMSIKERKIKNNGGKTFNKSPIIKPYLKP